MLYRTAQCYVRVYSAVDELYSAVLGYRVLYSALQGYIIILLYDVYI